MFEGQPLSSRRLSRMTSLALAALLFGQATALASAATRSHGGRVVRPQTLLDIGGKKLPLLRATKAGKGEGVRLDALLFLPSVDSRNRERGLDELARCVARLAKAPVRFVALAPDKTPIPALGDALRAAKLSVPTALDRGDALFSLLAIVARPSVVLLDEAHVVQATIPFHKINFCVAVEAHARFLLGELDRDGLERALRPQVKRAAGSGSPARRLVKLGQVLLRAHKPAKAEAQARRAVQEDPKLASAHALLGAALAAQGDCAKATEALTVALRLDPGNAQAKATSDRCKGH